MASSGISLMEILLASMLGMFTLAMGSVAIFVIYQRRMINKDLQHQKMESHYQKELLRTTIESQEKERIRIAHDLHDEIGMMLTTSRMYFDQLTPGHAEERLRPVSEKMNIIFDDVMKNIRRISHNLRPVVLENLGLVEAVESLTDNLADTGINLYVTHQIDIEINNDAQLILYRVVQELVNNTLKHAQATTIHLSLEMKDAYLNLTYQDNGIGFSGQPKSLKNGLGLKSIESRLNLLDGKLNITPGNPGVHIHTAIHCNKLM